MSSTVDQTILNMSPRHDRRKYLSWERSKASSSSSPRRRSCSFSAAEGPTSGGPQIAVMFDVVASTRVGRLLRRRFTEVCRRSQRAHCQPPSPCEMDGSPTVSSTLLRGARSTASYTDGGTRPQQSAVNTAHPRPPPGLASTVKRSTWSGTAMRPTNRLITHTADGPSTTARIVTRTGNTATSTSSLRDQITSFFQVSDNKLAMKLFGNKSALEKEKLRHKAVGHWVIHPCSDFRLLFHSQRSHFVREINKVSRRALGLILFEAVRIVMRCVDIAEQQTLLIWSLRSNNLR